MPGNSAPVEPSDRPARYGFWATLLWGIGIAAAILVAQIAIIFALWMARSGPFAKLDLAKGAEALAYNGVLLSWGTMMSALVACVLVSLAVRLKRGASLRDYLGLRTVAITTLLKWSGAVIGLGLASEFLQWILGRPISPEFMFTAYATADPVWALWVAVVLAAPLGEEIFFRGFLLAGWEATFLRPAGAVILTSALWTSIHTQYGPFELTFIFLLGLILGAARLATGSILLPLFLHCLVNLVGIIEVAAQR